MNESQIEIIDGIEVEYVDESYFSTPLPIDPNLLIDSEFDMSDDESFEKANLIMNEMYNDDFCIDVGGETYVKSSHASTLVGILLMSVDSALRDMQETDEPISLNMSMDSLQHLGTVIANQLAKNQDELMSHEEAAKMLSIHADTLSDWVTQGIVTPCKINGRRNLFSKNDLIAEIKQRKVAKEVPMHSAERFTTRKYSKA